MSLDIVLLLTTGLTTFVLIVIIETALRNYKAHKFFKEKSPNLPILSDCKIFSGHINQIYFNRYSWLEIDKNFKIYGKTWAGYYVDKPIVMTCDLELIKKLVIDEPYANINRIDLNIAFDELEFDCIPFAKDEQWKRLRKTIAPAFSTYKIKSPNVQAEIEGVIEKFSNSIKEKIDKAKFESEENSVTLDLEDICFRYSLDLTFTCFYKQNKLIDYHTENDRWSQRIDAGFRDFYNPIIRLVLMFPIIRPIIHWFIMTFNDVGPIRKDLGRFIWEQTDLYIKAQKEIEDSRESNLKRDVENFQLEDGSRFKKNMADYVIEQYQAGKLTRNEYYNSSFFLFFASNKTSADSVSKVIYHLAEYPKIQEKLRKSILESGVDSEYLSWCILESMRLFPPAMIGCSRMADKDIESDVGLIPKGTFVTTPAYTIHRLREYWGDDPDVFRPERWVNAENFHPCQYLAFGAGKRGCPGREFAIQEEKMLFNNLLRRYRFEKSPKLNHSMSYQTPSLIFCVADKPIYVKISLLEKQN